MKKQKEPNYQHCVVVTFENKNKKEKEKKTLSNEGITRRKKE